MKSHISNPEDFWRTQANLEWSLDKKTGSTKSSTSRSTTTSTTTTTCSNGSGCSSGTGCCCRCSCLPSVVVSSSTSITDTVTTAHQRQKLMKQRAQRDANTARAPAVDYEIRSRDLGHTHCGPYAGRLRPVYLYQI